MYHFFRVGTASPKCRVADCFYNVEEIKKCIDEASKNNVKLLVFPELCLTSYTCGDLFFQSSLIEAAYSALLDLVNYSKSVDMVIFVGLPVRCDNQTFNCAIALCGGKILSATVKTFVPNYSEFYEKRWFSSPDTLLSREITLCGQVVPIGGDLLLVSENIPYLTIGAEICEDLWSPVPPSSAQAVAGATVLVNLSASNELATKQEYRKSLICQQSARLVACYAYASAGLGESTQDLVFSGHCLISENGALLSENQRYSLENQLIFSDIDLELLTNDRNKNTSFMYQNSVGKPFRRIPFHLDGTQAETLERVIDPTPFVPKDDHRRFDRCQDIFSIQYTGLARRFSHTRAKSLVLGISGGLDSTLALLVAVKACDFLNISRKTVLGVTMPGFGTTDRTYQNALQLMDALGIRKREISIRDACEQHFRDIGHDGALHNVTYENTQARERTQILMDLANQENGLVVGTGDLSELALGWATYNGDHMSMYGVNAGVPKTLVRSLVQWVALNSALDSASRRILEDILDTPVSPELLPPDKDGKIKQKTEEIVGPYELHDFFLYYVVRCGFSPKKIYYLAQHAFDKTYDNRTLLKWLRNFYQRFFSQQFKRSCLPDGPKVGTISLSPRGDWRMPSDANNAVWIEELDRLEA